MLPFLLTHAAESAATKLFARFVAVVRAVTVIGTVTAQANALGGFI